jgi:hypothetical protein
MPVLKYSCLTLLYFCLSHKNFALCDLTFSFIHQTLCWNVYFFAMGSNGGFLPAIILFLSGFFRAYQNSKLTMNLQPIIAHWGPYKNTTQQ